MPATARLTDEHRGICSHGAPCCPHSVVGTISGASPDTNANALGVARLGDPVVHNCPHCGTGNITTASGTVKANGIGVARLGDEVTYPGGSGVITTASGNVNAGN
jgi:uncharacterized Zn-binding protein involved in type VI secretion